jgi:mediator of RNA polymerase II transcription subunit 8, fungi type
MVENSELFSRMALHPSTNFPGRTQEGILTQLLRKKLEPDVEELVDQGRDTARIVSPGGLAMLQEVWEECRRWAQERVGKYAAEESGDVYTREEREMGIENVRTGLKRDIEQDDDDDDESEEEDEADGDIEGAEGDAPKKKPDEGPKLPRGPEPETLLWFMARGDFAVPQNVEYERKVDVYRGLQGVNMFPSGTETDNDAMQP